MCVRKLLTVFTFNTVERRHFSLAKCLKKAFNKPPSANELPRPAGISAMFRLPVISSTEGMFSFVRTYLLKRLLINRVNIGKIEQYVRCWKDLHRLLQILNQQHIKNEGNLHCPASKFFIIVFF